MTQALINIKEDTNKIINIVKAKHGLKDKSEAIEYIIEHYIECEGEPNLKKEFIERIQRAEKGKFIKVEHFGKRYGVH